MNKKDLPETPFEIEKDLRRYFEIPQAPQSLGNRLEGQLLSRHAELVGAYRPGRQMTGRILRRFAPLTSRPGLSLGVLIAAILLAALLWIGPIRVLAEVERLLSYVPGVGFVNMGHTRILASPMLVTRRGVGVQVDRVIAGPESTNVLLSFSGLPEDHLQSGNPMDFEFSAALLLPDGSRLEVQSWSLDPSGASLAFAPLPTGVYRLALEFNRLPFYKAGTYPENWRIELILRDANGDLPAILFPQPYSPENALVSTNGVTVTVLQVAQAKEETAVQIQTRWQEPNWFTPMVGDPFMTLEDDQGLQYGQAILSASSAGVAVAGVVPPEPVESGAAPASSTYTQTLHFAPLSLSSQQVTMTLDELNFSAVTRVSFSIDLGQDPKVGDGWKLDMPLNVAGLPITLTSASVSKETLGGPNSPGQQDALVLEFNLPTGGDRTISGFDLRGQDTSPHSQTGSYDLHGHYTAVLFFDTLPKGSLALIIDQAQISVKGPWIFHWKVPGQAGKDTAVQAAPRHIYPQKVQSERNGLTIKLDEVVLSDRVSALKLSAQGAGPGWQIFNLQTGSLENQWGQKIDWPQSVILKESTGNSGNGTFVPLPNTISFGPLPPLSSQLNLTLESVDLFHPGQAAMDVEVPSGLAFAAEQYPVTVSGEGQAERLAMRSRLVSKSWPVDLAVDLSGYRIHFTQARLEKNGYSTSASTMLALTGDPMNADQGGNSLTQLRLSGLSRPDGSLLAGDPAKQDAYGEYLGYCGIGKQPGSNVIQASLSVPVSESMGKPLPGVYHIEFGGVVVSVNGPWQLSFDVSGVK